MQALTPKASHTLCAEERVIPTRAERDAAVFKEIEEILECEPIGDFILPSPNITLPGERELQERGFVRINDPRLRR